MRRSLGRRSLRAGPDVDAAHGAIVIDRLRRPMPTSHRIAYTCRWGRKEGTMKLASFETMLVLASLTMLALVVMGG